MSATTPVSSEAHEHAPPQGQLDVGSLDGEIYGADRLELHAVELARSHGLPSRATRAAPLLAQFQETKRAIEGDYAALSQSAQRRRDATPAVEWLLDNAHVISDQLHEIEKDLPRGYLLELPRLAHGPKKGYPRVYELALEFVAHTDGRVELATLERYVAAYQSIAPLAIGELWAVPIMLRLSLAESVRKLADQEIATGDGRVRADAWVERMLKGGARRSTDVALAMAELAVRDEVLEPAFVVQLLRRLREHDAVLTSAFHWIQERCTELGMAPAELTRLEHLRQSSAQVAIGHAISSMRAIAALDWGQFFEHTSEVERVLRGDPAGAYEATDAASRDRYRHAVERIAARSHVGELAVAMAAVRLASEAMRAPSATPRTSHVGYYLVDRGRAHLERVVGCRIGVRAWLQRELTKHATAAYFGVLGLGTAVGVASVLAVARHVEQPRPLLLACLALALVVPVSEVALTLINWAVMAVLPPRVLSKLAFEQGVPAEHRTLVAVPALLHSEADLYELLAELEVRSLANAGKNLHFALVTDFPDAETEERPGEDGLLELAKRGIAALNGRDEPHGEDRYILLHRRRLLNPAEGCWMGWERKRGKLKELNRLLRGKLDTSFAIVTAPTSLLCSIRYVLTLDTDTHLPREVVRRLVGTIAHPLNRPELSSAGNCVIAGYGVIQPRVGTTLASTSRSRFAHAYGGRGGIDPYTTAVSDVYQDLFGEGVYIGKALYDVDAFEASLAGRIPDNRMLSHDLFEGLYARTALASDIELLDDQPSGYRVHTRRQHRWARGDWQLASWLLPRVPAARGVSRRNDLSLLSRWKIFDNLRRSLLAPCMVGLLAFGWFVLPRIAALLTVVVGFALATPLCARLVTAVLRPDDRAWSRSFVRTLWADVLANLVQLGLAATFLLDQAGLMLDAIARALYRVAVGRDLLEWMTASDSERTSAFDNASELWRMNFGSAASVAVAIGVVGWSAHPMLPLPFLAAWAAAPAVALWISKPIARRERPLSPASRASLRRIARKTWRFFDVFVTAEDHWLPPDNYQEDPKDVVAHRTSPTNIGLYLLSAVAARDFGYLTLRELTERLENTLTTIDVLELHAGHVLNWYHTTTLAPLTPRYVSTVDSGNLVAHLWTVAQGCRDLADAPIVSASALDAAVDAIALFRGALSSAKSPPLPPALAAELSVVESTLEKLRVAPPADVSAWLLALDELSSRARPLATWCGALLDEAATADLEAAVYWSERIAGGLGDAARELRALAPWAADLGAAPLALSRTAGWPSFLAELGSVPSAFSVAARVARVAERIAVLEGELDEGDPSASNARSWLTLLAARLTEAEATGAALVGRLAAVAERASARADGMCFRLLYHEERKLFSIGYDVVAGRLDASSYDLLASEARLASLVAIAKGEVPQEHWFRLGRQLVSAAERRALLSWSGSMFEYLMPLLVTRTYERTLLEETYVSIVSRQREYGGERGVPWGVSESAYNTLDLGLTYQYQAFGVPGLGLKQGLADELVVAPYASALASLVNPDLASRNLAALARDGADGRYGFYDAIDYTAAHVPLGRRGVVVRAFFAHHEGMTLVALDNVLNGDLMQRRFHLDPRVKATELLLQERVPVVATLALWRGGDVTPATPSPDEAAGAVEHILGTRPLAPRAHLLAYGDFSILLMANGQGWMRWRDLDVTRWRDDAAIGAFGSFCYVRDKDSGAFWSTSYQPTLREPEHYAASFAADRVTLHRRDGAIEILTEVAVSPEHPAEVRRITVTNHDSRTRHIELTTYLEVVLADRGADLAHPVFSDMFVETEAAASQSAVLATRRQRAPTDPTPWVVHVMALEEGDAGPLEYETSRARFIGRGRTLESPLALERAEPLSRTTGTVLDPILSLRSVLTIPPNSRARIAFATAVASSREGVLHLAETFRDARSSARTFELAWTDARVELRHLGISAAQAQLFQRLSSAVVFPSTGLRGPPEVLARNKGSQQGLWRYGISGDLPILLVRLDDPDAAELLAEVLLAHEFWRLNGLAVDLVILNEEPSSYLQPQQEGMLHAIRKSPTQAPLDQPGGVFVRRADQMPGPDHILLQSFARVVLLASQGSLSRQIRRSVREPRTSARFEAPMSPVRAVPSPVVVPTLLFWNGLGGFRADGREYVMVLCDETRTPAPWCNVVANPRFGFVLSESGAGFTWSENSQTHRLTPWSNDPISDPSGESIYLRDDDDGAVWSPTPGPVRAGLNYVVRHGQGYSTFELRRGSLAHELTVFVAPDANVKIWRLKLRNAGRRPRRISAYAYAEWVLGATRGKSALSVVTEAELGVGAVLATSPAAPFPKRVAFLAASAAPRGVTGDRLEFLGRGGSRGQPAALLQATLSGNVGAGLDPCAAVHVETTIAPGETRELVFVLGEGESREDAVALARAYREPARARATLDAAVRHWDEILGVVQVDTPDVAFNLLMNRWLLYQTVSCRLWARSACYQSGGAYGFRDQLQDILATVHAAPGLAREHILRAAARQFREGDVQHWWHPESGQGVRTRCVDDMLWLPFVVTRYVEATGDDPILDELVAFLEAHTLEPEEHEAFGIPATTLERATLYEHCTRALDRGATAGAHGLPLMGGGDWNDGMNRVGVAGRGESVWVAWFLASTLRSFADVARKRGDILRAERCESEVIRLAAAAEATSWDGAWYRRAYYDDGAPLGAAGDAECAIDVIAQSWAVISGVADRTRERRAMCSADDRLVKAEVGMILLFAPPFINGPRDPGYVRGYPAGLRENGGQYTHGALWSVLAQTLLNNGDRAGELFDLLNPIRHGSTPEQVARYRVEPYVVAADVYAAEGHVGRGGWTWYTGSAAWMYTIGVESMLGVTRHGASLRVAPCIPRAWAGYTVVYRHGASTYRVVVENNCCDTKADGCVPAAGVSSRDTDPPTPLGQDARSRPQSTRVARLELDGEPLAVAADVPLVDDGREHVLRVIARPSSSTGDGAIDQKPSS